MTQDSLNFTASVPLPELLAADNFCARLAKYLIEHRGEWIDGLTLARIGGAYAWRSRLSEIRRAPWFLTIENRQRQERVECPVCDGDGDGGHWQRVNCPRCKGGGKVNYTISEYRVP